MNCTVQVESGLLAGKWSEDQSICSFKGVPYAQPPVGRLRWRRRSRRSNGAACDRPTTFGPRCVQPNRPPHAVGYFGPEAGERRLPLSQRLDRRTCERRKRPVMVWLHGGALPGRVGIAADLRRQRAGAQSAARGGDGQLSARPARLSGASRAQRRAAPSQHLRQLRPCSTRSRRCAGCRPTSRRSAATPAA